MSMKWTDFAALTSGWAKMAQDYPGDDAASTAAARARAVPFRPLRAPEDTGMRDAFQNGLGRRSVNSVAGMNQMDEPQWEEFAGGPVANQWASRTNELVGKNPAEFQMAQLWAKNNGYDFGVVNTGATWGDMVLTKGDQQNRFRYDPSGNKWVEMNINGRGRADKPSGIGDQILTPSDTGTSMTGYRPVAHSQDTANQMDTARTGKDVNRVMDNQRNRSIAQGQAWILGANGVEAMGQRNPKPTQAQGQPTAQQGPTAPAGASVSPPPKPKVERYGNYATNGKAWAQFGPDGKARAVDAPRSAQMMQNLNRADGGRHLKELQDMARERGEGFSARYDASTGKYYTRNNHGVEREVARGANGKWSRVMNVNKAPKYNVQFFGDKKMADQLANSDLGRRLMYGPKTTPTVASAGPSKVYNISGVTSSFRPKGAPRRVSYSGFSGGMPGRRMGRV